MPQKTDLWIILFKALLITTLWTYSKIFLPQKKDYKNIHKMPVWTHALNCLPCARFGSTCAKIGTIQRLAWPLHKDDTQICEVFHVFIYNGILLSHKKEQNWVICRDMDGDRDCHTEWNKSEREKQISYIDAYLWNLEKRYRWTGLQDRNRDTDVENKRMHTKQGKRGWNEMGDWN